MRIMLAAMLAALAVFWPAMAQDYDRPCASMINETVARYGVAPSDVREMAFIRDKSGNDDSPVVGYHAWMRIRQCAGGYLVVYVTAACHLVTVYTTEPCRVPGLTQY